MARETARRRAFEAQLNALAASRDGQETLARAWAATARAWRAYAERLP
jgi:hypothetical protein